jgi:organic radical activating enzyme
MNEVICSLPFGTIHNMPSQYYKPCCWSNASTSSSPKDTTPMEHFNGEELSQIRKEMLAGEKTEFLRKYCNNCWRWEETLGSSPRTQNIPSEELISNFDLNGKFLETDDRFLKIAINVYGNYCNLECYMCHSELSSSRNSALKKLPSEWKNHCGMESYDIPSDEIIISTKPNLKLFDCDIKKTNHQQFNQIIDELVKYSKNIEKIEVIGGEPMLMKSHFILLDRLIECEEAKNIKLYYVSNMTMMNVTEVNDKYFKKFNRVHVQWSMEGLEKRNEWLRYPTRWKETVNNVKQFQKIVGNGIIRATMTPSILSVYTLKETCNWLYLNSLMDNQFIINNILEKPYMLHPRHLPNEIKEEILPKLSKITQKISSLISLERSEEEFQRALRYFDDLDQSRGTDWKSTFPELAHYSK